MFETDPIKRFSKTVENYQAYRPGYPAQIIEFMQEKLWLNSESVVADIGSGTGKLTTLFLKNGNPTFAIEPNNEMRIAAEHLFNEFPNFQSVNGTAEKTKLKDKSVDFIVAGQAFHWFDPQRAKTEFNRILNNDGKILLIWNKRIDEKYVFMKAYNDFLKDWATDYEATSLRKIDQKVLTDFYAPKRFNRKDFFHFQSFDFESLKGRYLSCSYAFDSLHPKHKKAIDVLKNTFEHFQKDGHVEMWYRAEVYYDC
jgi:ubiquinone/menaquinone biosynthesis C-methylase UbiE